MIFRVLATTTDECGLLHREQLLLLHRETSKKAVCAKSLQQ
jgi:hypothetical protein